MKKVYQNFLDIIDDDPDEQVFRDVVHNNIFRWHPVDRDELIKCILYHIKVGNTNLNDIDVSRITNFQELFSRVIDIVQKDNSITETELEVFFKYLDISLWDVSNGINFDKMFFKVPNFNSDISMWNVSSAESFAYMFLCCKDFNCDLSDWNVSNCSVFTGMFDGCWKFESNLNKWNVKKGRVFNIMFRNCYSGEIYIDEWDLSHVDSKNKWNMCIYSNVIMPENKS